jgi:hypothetical protein
MHTTDLIDHLVNTEDGLEVLIFNTDAERYRLVFRDLDEDETIYARTYESHAELATVYSHAERFLGRDWCATIESIINSKPKITTNGAA